MRKLNYHELAQKTIIYHFFGKVSSKTTNLYTFGT